VGISNFLSPPASRHTHGRRRPLLIFAFDECHDLTTHPMDSPGTLFSELRHVLHVLCKEPIFSLFLFTTSKFHLFNPETLADPCTRIQLGKLHTLPPITEIVFDDLSYTTIEGHTTLDEVVEDKWMSHMGRPLYIFRHHIFSSLTTLAVLAPTMMP
jgi:hypothetical protein